MRYHQLVEHSLKTMPLQIDPIFFEFIPARFRDNPMVQKALFRPTLKFNNLANKGMYRDTSHTTSGYLPVFYLMRAAKYDSAPRIVSNAQFERLYETGRYMQLWRGVPRAKWADALKYSVRPFAGQRDYVIGIWTASGEDGWAMAKGYTRGNTTNLMRMLLPESAKIASADDLDRTAADLRHDVRTGVAEKSRRLDARARQMLEWQALLLMEDFFGLISVAAIFAGYDAVEVYGAHQVVVLNRSKLIVQHETPTVG